MIEQEVELLASNRPRTAKLNTDTLKDIDLEKYPVKRAHFLALALQKQTSLPQEKTMSRTEKRNQRKIQSKVSHQNQKRMRQKQQAKKKTFYIPNKYGPKPRIRRIKENKKIDFSINQPPMLQPFFNPFPMTPVLQGLPLNPPSFSQIIPLQQSFLPPIPQGFTSLPLSGSPSVHEQPYSLSTIEKTSNIFLPPGFALGNLLKPAVINTCPVPSGLIQHPRPQNNKLQILVNSISLPIKILKKTKVFASPKQQNRCFKVQSPQQLIQKSERAQFTKLIQQILTQDEKQASHPKAIQSINRQKRIPEYFQKKKASQKRRRKEKHYLIKKYKKQLLSIFGNAIFQSGWPVSRQQIKLALGIQEEEFNFEEFQEFITMSEEKTKIVQEEIDEEW